MTKEEMLALCTAVTTELGKGWRLEYDHENYAPTCLLYGPDGTDLYIRKGSQPTLEVGVSLRRLMVQEALTPSDWRQHVSPINISPTKAPRLIARDITRRIVPRAQESVREIKKAAALYRQRQRGALVTTCALAQALGVDPPRQSKNSSGVNPYSLRLWDLPGGGWGDLTVRDYEPFSVDMGLRGISQETALQIAALLKKG